MYILILLKNLLKNDNILKVNDMSSQSIFFFFYFNFEYLKIYRREGIKIEKDN